MSSLSTRADYLIPAALIALAVIPVLAGAVRLTSLAIGTSINPDNARFFAAPHPRGAAHRQCHPLLPPRGVPIRARLPAAAAGLASRGGAGETGCRALTSR